ncbi:hypothetical protein P355_2018 [Burkholderia cenocepacia KC-01]|nr:hypothetical protein P355_2018 [Burkholderia cenocepacia KC-01]
MTRRRTPNRSVRGARRRPALRRTTGVHHVFPAQCLRSARPRAAEPRRDGADDALARAVARAAHRTDGRVLRAARVGRPDRDRSHQRQPGVRRIRADAGPRRRCAGRRLENRHRCRPCERRAHLRAAVAWRARQLADAARRRRAAVAVRRERRPRTVAGLGAAAERLLHEDSCDAVARDDDR